MFRNRKIWLRLLSLVVLAILAFFSLRAFLKPEPLDVQFEAFLARHNLPGAVVALSGPDLAPQLRAFGVADAASGRAMEQTDRFRLASLSKPVTATAVLRQLERMPQVDLDSSAAAHIPVLQQSIDPRAAQITFRDLLRHSTGWDSTAGLAPFFLNPSELTSELGLTSTSISDCEPVAAAMVRKPLQTAPGTAFAYSNLGYCLLGLWLEEVTGRPYSAAVSTLVPEARGLSVVAADVTVRHHGLEGHQSLLAVQPQVIAAAGGWIGPAAAYAAFASVPIDPVILERPQYAADGPSFYGLGWRVWPREGDPLLSHYGAVPGVFSVVVRTLDGHAVTVLFNGRPEQEVAAFLEFFQLASGLRHLSAP